MKNLSADKIREVRLNPPQLMNIAEAAAYLCVGQRKLWDETARGRVRCARIGNRLVFQKTELDRWVAVLAAQSAA